MKKSKKQKLDESVRKARAARTPKETPLQKTRRFALWERGRSTGNKFMFEPDLTSVLTTQTALFLIDLVNRKQRIRIVNMERLSKQQPPCVETIGTEEWFMCTTKFLQAPGHIKWSEDKQKYHLDTLKKRGFIKVKNRGVPGCRWIFIDLDEIEYAVETELGPVESRDFGTENMVL